MRLDFTPRLQYDPTPGVPTADDLKNMETLAEEQIKFNDELNATKDIYDKITGADKTILDNLGKKIINVEKLNIRYGLGQKILAEVNKKQIDSEVELNLLQTQRERILKRISTAKKDDVVKDLKAQLANNSAQLQVQRALDSNLRLIQEAAEAEQKKADELKSQNSLIDIAAKKRKDIEDSISKYFSLASIFKIIIDGALNFNKVSVDIGKNLGYSASQADRVASDFKNLAETSGDVYLTLANIAEAANQISEATGFVSEYSADTLKTQIMLTKQFGLTGDEAAGIYQYSVLTGKAASEVNEAMVRAYVATRNQLGVGVPFKATIAAAAKVSGELAANLQNNPEAIVRAVTQAKALGTSLEQVKGQGDKLLDFESSIESQLKAQLLTGESLNLERARAAALAGDQITLAKELSNQGMTLSKFEHMNVLAKRAYAEAVGLTSDQLSDQLKKQQLAIQSGKSLAQITEEDALQAEKRVAVQDKFNQAVLKLQDFFGNLLAGPVGGLLEALTNMLPIIEDIGVAYGVWWTISKGIAISQALSSGSLLAQISGLPALIGLKSTEAAIATETAAATTVTAEAATFGAATLWIVGGLSAVLGALAGYGVSKAGDMVSPADGKTMVSTKEGGLFELSKNDDLLAGPGLAKGGGGDLSPLVSAINAVKASVDRLYAKEGVVNLDGKRVGTLLTQGSYKTA
jgi:hypothetical protein